MTITMNKKLLELITFVFLLCVATGVDARGELIMDTEFPVQNEQVRVRITNDDGSPVAGATVRVTYRPGSSVEREEPVGVSAEDGSVDWVPAEAGIANVTASWQAADKSEATATTAVSVRYKSPPVAGILVMVIAGLLLVVGSVIRMFNVIRTPQAP